MRMILVPTMLSMAQDSYQNQSTTVTQRHLICHTTVLRMLHCLPLIQVLPTISLIQPPQACVDICQFHRSQPALVPCQYCTPRAFSQCSLHCPRACIWILATVEDRAPLYRAKAGLLPGVTTQTMLIQTLKIHMQGLRALLLGNQNQGQIDFSPCISVTGNTLGSAIRSVTCVIITSSH
jgi:hypothetical protein